MILYPLAMMISWVPSVAYAYYFNFYYIKYSGSKPPNGTIISNYLSVLNVLYGFLLSLIFYTKTIDARREWIYILRYLLSFMTKVDEIDDRRTCVSILSVDDIRVSEIELNRSTLSTVTDVASSTWNYNNANSSLNPIVSTSRRISFTEV